MSAAHKLAHLHSSIKYASDPLKKRDSMHPTTGTIMQRLHTPCSGGSSPIITTHIQRKAQNNNYGTADMEARKMHMHA